MRNLAAVLAIILTAGSGLSCSFRFYSTGCDLPIPGNLEKCSNLDSVLHETSGLVYLEGHFWTFNDSGGEAALYCIREDDGSVIRKTIIANATNTDWEDIAMDHDYLYVADVGDNLASRDTLLIYRVPKTGLMSGEPEIYHDGIISISFDEVITRNSSSRSSHDCEAIFACDDSLYLFSKDWTGRSTSVYAVPSEPGHYHIRSVYNYRVQILVTGADLFRDEQQVVLIGYSGFIPAVIRYGYDGDPGRITCGGRARLYPLKMGRQVEGICFDPGGKVYISSEKSFQRQALFRLRDTVHSH